MKAFWWFKENSIAGMGRPGFNAVHWFDLSFTEAVLLGWLGKYSSGSASLESFRSHLKTYAPKILKFYHIDEKKDAQALEIFAENAGIRKTMVTLIERTNIFEHFEIVDDQLNVTLSRQRLNYEIEFLKKNRIRKVVSLTENHHQKESLQEHFDLHHIGIEDLNAPKLEQVHHLAEVIQSSVKNKESIAVHCLAGIGRTSTMLMASHIVLGEQADEVESRLKKQNPTFVLTGSQGEFIRSLARQK